MQELLFILKFFSDNVHVLGWVAVTFAVLKLAWKASRFFDDLIESASKVHTMEDTVQLLATNHLPHIEKEISDLNLSVRDLKSDLVTELRGLRSDLFQIAMKKE